MNLERHNGFFYAETSRKVPLSSQFDESPMHFLVLNKRNRVFWVLLVWCLVAEGKSDADSFI